MKNIEVIAKKGKLIETLFTSESVYDTKRKTNLNPMINFDESIIEQIENGNITTELLESLNIDILRYKTQITLHADFSDVLAEKYHGYKSLILNKNNSLGVKYIAIDENKRKLIAEKLRFAGLKYYRNSTDAYFSHMIRLNDNDVESFDNICKLFNIARDNNDLFIGNSNLSKFSFYGEIYIILTLHIKSIRFENIKVLCDAFGITDDVYEVHKNKEKEARQAMISAHNSNRQYRENSIRKIMETVTESHTLTNIIIDKDCEFIAPIVNTIWGRGDEKDEFELVFKLNVFRKIGRKRNYSKFEIEFQTYDEALNYYNTNAETILDKMQNSYTLYDYKVGTIFKNVILIN